MIGVTWNASRLNDLVLELRTRRGDTTNVEVKAAADGCPSLGRTLSAFANMPDGGTIILGLDENSGFIPTGLTDIATLEQGVASQARTAVSPEVQCSFNTFEISGAPALVCTIAPLPLEDRPARHNGKAYLRQSDGDYELGEQELAQLELLKTQARRPTHPDREPVPGTGIDDLDNDLVSTFIAAVRASSRRHAAVDDVEILRRKNVLTMEGEATVAGLYALGDYPQRHLPHLAVTVAVRLPRTSGARTRDLLHLDGPLPAMLDDAMAWVRRNTLTTMGYDDLGHGRDTDELPMLAVREIIANALVHRNLDAITENKEIDVRLLDDRLVVTSPGGLWGVTERQLGRPGGKSAVNTTLYEICRHVRLPDGHRVVEGEGGGIREAQLAIRAAGLRPLTFIDTSLRFTVLVSRHTLLSSDDLAWLAALPHADELSSEQRSIIAGMRHGVTWTNSLVRETFAPMDSVEARKVLQQLVDLGLAAMVGDRGSAAYVLANELVPAEQRGSAIALDLGDLDSAAPVPSDVARITANAGAIWTALTSPLSLAELISITSLTEQQVRYALTRMRRSGAITMVGIQGDRDTRYRRSEPDTAPLNDPGDDT